MSRRAQAPRRDSLPDPKFGNAMLAKFINMVMKSGKKSVAEKIVYGAIERMSERVGKDQSRAIELLSQALDNIKPAVEVKSRRVGGATYQVPVEVRAARRETLAMRWAIEAARSAPRRAWPCAWRTSSSTPPRIAAPQSRNAKTRTEWRTPTKRSRTIAGSDGQAACTWHGRPHSHGIGISASWPTSMPARRRLPSESCSTRGSRSGSVRSMTARPSWTGWSRSKSAVSRSRRPRRPASGRG